MWEDLLRKAAGVRGGCSVGFRSRAGKLNRGVAARQIKTAKIVGAELRAEERQKMAELDAKLAELRVETAKAEKDPDGYDGPMYDLYREAQSLGVELEMIRESQGINGANMSEATLKRYWS